MLGDLVECACFVLAVLDVAPFTASNPIVGKLDCICQIATAFYMFKAGTPRALEYLVAAVIDCYAPEIGTAGAAVFGCVWSAIATAEGGPAGLVACILGAIGAIPLLGGMFEEIVDLLTLMWELDVLDQTLFDGVCTCLHLAGVCCK